ncbi:MAG: hypothetical protein CYG61_07095 [Actinobacteria bacterium]|nr:MAG: hypothetical protein CYG61_07095 [Actinomycetota bacterium]
MNDVQWVALLASGHASRAEIVVPLVLAAVLSAVVALVWAFHFRGREPGPPEAPAGNRWRSRPVLAAVLVGIAHVVPVAAAVAASALLSRQLPAPEGALRTALSWALLLLVSTIVVFVVERLARRLLPLATLLRLSMLFPDHAPQRLAVARKAGSVHDLEHRLALARSSGLDDEPAQAAETILTLVGALHAHDRRTRGHSERVRVFVDLLADELNLPMADRDRLRWAALLHDIGKLEISPRVLNKPDKLDVLEWRAVQNHPDAGARLIRPLRPWLGRWGATIEQHHEQWDGSGYPRGLRGEQISLGARIVAVADGYEVMTAVRAYKRPMSVAAARQELTRCAGTQFDPALVRAFLNVSLGRVRWGAGPVAWLAQIPFVGWVPGLAQGVVATGGQVAATIGTAAGVAAVTTTGAAIGVLPVASNEVPVAANGPEAPAGSPPAEPEAPAQEELGPGATTTTLPTESTVRAEAPGVRPTPPTSAPTSARTSASTTSAPPQGFALRSLEMSDTDANGRVDRVVATFSEPLAASSSTSPGPWTLSNVPSGGRLGSVTVAGSQAVLDLTEGSGAPDTAVGTFTIALASTSEGIQNQAGQSASFPPTPPLDRAAPVPLVVASTTGGPTAGRIEAGDELSVSFSEPLSALSVPTSTVVSQINVEEGNDQLDIEGVTAGPLDTGSGGYVVEEGPNLGFSDSTVALSNGGSTLTVVVGATCTDCSGAEPSAGALVFLPAPTLTDAAGNGAAGSFTTPEEFQLF